MIVRTLVSQWSSVVISLFIAVFLWVVATNEENPTREDLFPDPLPVEFTKPAQGLSLYTKSFDTVRIRVRAPEALWKNLRADDFHVIADLKGLGEGQHEINLQVQPRDAQVNIVALEPPAVTVRLEPIKEITMDVHTRVLDDPPVGYEFHPPVITPFRVIVAGPKVLVDQVSDVTADLALRSSKITVDRDVPVVVHDVQGKPIETLTVTPTSVSVHVEVDQKVGYKDVAIKAVVKGNVASGYWISDISVDPATVTLVGAADALDKIPGFVEAQAVTVTNARADITKRVGLNLPAGVSALNVTDVATRVAVEPVLGGITILRAVSVSKPGCVFPTVVSPDSVGVILSGPLPILQSLGADDVQVVVDLIDCVPGSVQLAPHAVNLPDKLKVESLVPNTVEVDIKHQ